MRLHKFVTCEQHVVVQYGVLKFLMVYVYIKSTNATFMKIYSFLKKKNIHHSEMLKCFDGDSWYDDMS